MVMRVVERVSDTGSVIASTATTRSVEIIKNVTAPLPVTKVVAGITIPVVGQNLVQNAVVSSTPPPNPYEGQVWIEV